MIDLAIIGGITIAILSLLGIGMSIALMMANETIRERYEDEDWLDG
jgi:hypothetical protein